MDWLTKLMSCFVPTTKGGQKVSLDLIRNLEELARHLNEWLKGLLPTESVEQMTYAAAIEYFIDHRPPDPRVQKGAMLLQDQPKGKLLIQVFLDEQNELICKPPDGKKPYGRRILVHAFDEELSAAFENTDLVLVE